jgi:hypothetical protein
MLDASFYDFSCLGLELHVLLFVHALDLCILRLYTVSHYKTLILRFFLNNALNL